MEPALRHECQRLVKVGSAASSGKGVDGDDILPRKAVRRYFVLGFFLFYEEEKKSATKKRAWIELNLSIYQK